MKARVLLHEQSVGHLEYRGSRTTFRFSEEYLALPERPVLGRWFEDHLTLGVVTRASHGALPPFFENALPEPNSPLRALLADRAGVRETRELALLVALGADLPGAMSVVLEDEEGELAPPESDAPSAAATDAAPEGPLRFSLAGMQMKLSVLRDGGRLTVPATGVGGRFILKLPSAQFTNLPRNEHVVMRWAERAGIRTAPTSLVALADIDGLPADLPRPEPEALLVARYDRPPSGGPRVHQEDFAQVLDVPSTRKYGPEAGVTFDRIGLVIAQVAGRGDFEEFVRRLAFCVLCQNPDAHLKNWSFWYPDPRVARLSPAYDLISTCLYPGYGAKLACKLGGERTLASVRAHHFGVLASRAGYAAADGVALATEAGERTRAAWRDLPSHLDVPPDLGAAITRHLDETRFP